MCNEDLIDSMKEVIARFITHTSDLRNRFNSIEEEYREGNLDGQSLAQLNQVVHLLETDSAAIEKVLGG
ncbi:MAG: hypothetical protein ACYCW5_04480 [Thermoleophilia bacterium]